MYYEFCNHNVNINCTRYSAQLFIVSKNIPPSLISITKDKVVVEPCESQE